MNVVEYSFQMGTNIMSTAKKASAQTARIAFQKEEKFMEGIFSRGKTTKRADVDLKSGHYFKKSQERKQTKMA